MMFIKFIMFRKFIMDFCAEKVQIHAYMTTLRYKFPRNFIKMINIPIRAIIVSFRYSRVMPAPSLMQVYHLRRITFIHVLSTQFWVGWESLFSFILEINEKYVIQTWFGLTPDNHVKTYYEIVYNWYSNNIPRSLV